VWSARPPADDTEYQLAQLAQRYRDLGEEADALICEQRIAIDGGDEDRAVSIVADVDAVGNREQKLRVRAKLFSVGGDFSAVTLASETRTMIAEGGPLNANERALVAILLANGAEDAETVLPVLDEALNLLLPGEWPEFRALLLSNRGMARLRFGQADAGQADLLAAEHTAADAGELNALAVVLEQRARFVWDTDMAGGERNMLRARWAALQAGNTESLTASGGMLTELLFDTGKYFEAAEYLYDTLAELDDDDLPESPRRRNVALRLRSQLERIGAKVLRACEDQLDTEDDGLGSETMLRSAIDDMEAAGDLEELASAHFELGELLTETDALEALHEYDLAADLARDAGDTRLSMVIARERVHAVMTADGPDAALAALESCAAMNEKLWLDTLTDPDLRDSLNWDFDTEELRLTEMRIRVLRTANRSGEALGLIDKLANSFHVREQAGSATRLRILHADLLMDVGNRESALDEFRGAAADAMADNDPDLARFAAFRGAERLRESGEPDAAMAFWQSLNPDDDE
jgi:tetratricopeptide (TPR) repeat protein